MATSCVAVLAIALACIGRLRAFDDAETRPAGRQSEHRARSRTRSSPRSAPSSPTRTTAASRPRELFRFLSSDAGERRALPNVGAISRATVSTKRDPDAKNLQAFAERVRAETGALRPASTSPSSPRRHLEAEAVAERPDTRRVQAVSRGCSARCTWSAFTPSRWSGGGGASRPICCCWPPPTC